MHLEGVEGIYEENYDRYDKLCYSCFTKKYNHSGPVRVGKRHNAFKKRGKVEKNREGSEQVATKMVEAKSLKNYITCQTQRYEDVPNKDWCDKDFQQK
jgi:hypothetical protein